MADVQQDRSQQDRSQRDPGNPPDEEARLAEIEEAGEVAELRRQVAELRRQVAESDDRWRRTAADLDNVRKRAARELEQVRADERARVTAHWLPVLDNLDLALEHAQADARTIVSGVRAVREQAAAVLSQLGYERIDDVGRPFDPNRHEVVSTTPDPSSAEGTIVHVVRPGYADSERLVRPASVVVASGGA